MPFNFNLFCNNPYVLKNLLKSKINNNTKEIIMAYCATFNVLNAISRVNGKSNIPIILFNRNIEKI